MLSRFWIFPIIALFIASTGFAQQWPAGEWKTAVISTTDAVHQAEAAATWNGNSLTVTAGGDDIWNTADQCTFVYKEVSGDFDVAITVNALEQTNDWAKAGLMVRQNLEPGSTNVLAAVRGLADLVTFQWRGEHEGASASQRLTTTNGSIPVSIRLTGQSGVISGTYTPEYTDPDSWTPTEELDSTDGEPPDPIDLIAWADPVLVGIAVTSHQAGVITTAEIELIGGDDATAVEAGGKLSTTWARIRAGR